MIKTKFIVVFSILSAGILFFAVGKADNMSPEKKSGIRISELKDGGFEVEGDKADSWGYMTYPDKGDKDVQINGTFKILKTGGTFNPPTPYWPLTFHYLADEPGYDFGIMARTENSGVFYRVQVSCKWDEVSLWKEGVPGTDPGAPSIPSGFFAAVRTKAGIKVNQENKFTLKVMGNKLEFALNGKAILAYEDKLLPLEKGAWGLGVFNGAKVLVSGLEAKKASGSISVIQLKRPTFRVAKWHRGGGEATVIFDGDEPVACQSQGTAAWLTDVKFKPGYRAQYAWPFLYDNKYRASAWKELKAVNDTVVGMVSDSGKTSEELDGKSTVILRYDAQKDVYSYDLDVSLTLKKDNSETKIMNRNTVYYENTYAYNPMPTTEDSVKVNYFNWSTASSPYRMALVKLADGKTYRWPIQHFYPFVKPGYEGGVFWSQWESMKLHEKPFFMRYPEKVVCPTTEILSQGDGGGYETIFNSCCQYWDMHFYCQPLRDGKKVTEYKTGETYREKFRIFGTPAADADLLMKESQLLPCFDPSIEHPYYVNGINRFDQGGNVETTAGRLIWDGGKWDKTFGRDDKFSLRFDGNGSSSVFLGYNGSSAESKKARLSMWVKSEKPWSGSGVRFGFEGRGRFGGVDRQYCDFVVPEDKEWKQVVYDIPFPTYYEVCITIESKGNCKVWIDDLEYKILEKQ